MAFTTKLLRALTYAKYRRFVRACQRPELEAARQWRLIKEDLKGGTFWQGRIPEELSACPVTDYETYRTALEAAYASTQCPLTGKRILFWSESGGTTGKSKIYPITAAFKKSFQSITPPFVHSLCSRFPDFLSAPALYFASTLPTEKSPAGIEKGYISGYNYRNISPLLARKYAFPIEVFRDRETFFRWAPLYALATDLSAMIAITPSMLEQFALAVEENLSSYWPFLEAPIAPAPGLPPAHCPPERLRHLRAMKEFTFSQAWPSLQFLSCWKTATCGLQLPRLERWVQGIPIIDAPYSATEGWMTVPLANEKNGGALQPEALIAEFFPAGENPSPHNIRQAWELEPGRDYEILLTTRMGFVRFRLYDVVHCTGFFHRSPILEFKEKAGNAVSLGQARISETHILQALAKSRVEWPSPWLFAPNASGNGLLFHHREAIPQLPESLAAFEHALSGLNAEYADDVANHLLEPIAPAHLPAQHELWTATTHAQTKPKVIQQRPVRN